MVSSRPTTVSALSQQHSWPPACAGALLWAGKIPRGPDDQPGSHSCSECRDWQGLQDVRGCGKEGSEEDSVDFGGI